MFGQRQRQDTMRNNHPRGGCSGQGKHRGGRGGRGGMGMRKGSGGRGVARDFRGYDLPEQARPENAIQGQDAPPQMQTQVRQDVNGPQEARQPGVCPICKNHCPLSEPGCDKGKAYALSMQTGVEEKINL